MNYCNTLFYDLPKYYLHRLLKEQNIVTRLTTSVLVRPSHFFASSILKSLQWHSPFHCFNFKIFCMTLLNLSFGEPYYFTANSSIKCISVFQLRVREDRAVKQAAKGGE